MQACKHHWIIDCAGPVAVCRECGASKMFAAAATADEAIESGKRGAEHVIPSLESVMTLRGGPLREEIRWGRYAGPEALTL